MLKRNVVMCAILLGAGSSAAESDEEFLDSSACPEVFGGDDARHDNERDRRQSLYTFASGEKGWDIVHTVPKWTRPVPLRLGDILVEGLAEVEPEPEAPDVSAIAPAPASAESSVKPAVEMAKKPPAAPRAPEDVLVVRLSGDLSTQCAAGPYLVRVDDALGQRARVLGTSDEGALVEMDGRLHAVTFEGERVPERVRMVWRSAYDISLASQGGGSSTKKATKAKAKTKKAKRKKKKAKKKKRK